MNPQAAKKSEAAKRTVGKVEPFGRGGLVGVIQRRQPAVAGTDVLDPGCYSRKFHQLTRLREKHDEVPLAMAS